MSDILFFSRDPGAANCIIPVYKKVVEENDNTFDLYGKDFALDKYRESGIKGKDILKEIGLVDRENIKKFLEGKSYKVLVLGSSFEDETERIMIEVAKDLNIKTISIIDNWMNYKKRYVRQDIENAEPVYPDTICTMDEFSKQETIEEGVPDDVVRVTGQPYFETVALRNKDIDLNSIKQDKETLGVNDEKLIVFASESIKSAPKIEEELGYNQGDILKAFLETVVELDKKHKDQKLKILVRPHPRDDIDLLQKTINNLDFPANIDVFLSDELNSQEIISAADLVVGMSSMFLLESILFHKPIMSIQIGLKKRDPFFLSRFGRVESVLNKEELESQVENMVFKSEYHPIEIDIVKGASDKIISIIKEHL
ncbi:hypothetical protein H6775_01750 [Candidatus Nomurabacteria bacterium]|nr:hypothetical protein [Candidatus Nomurabacteria bacterium]